MSILVIVNRMMIRILVVVRLIMIVYDDDSHNASIFGDEDDFCDNYGYEDYDGGCYH